MTFREKGQKKPEAASLPCYSVDTVAEARQLIVLHCTRSYDGKWLWPGFEYLADRMGTDALIYASGFLDLAYRQMMQEEKNMSRGPIDGVKLGPGNQLFPDPEESNRAIDNLIDHVKQEMVQKSMEQYKAEFQSFMRVREGDFPLLILQRELEYIQVQSEIETLEEQLAHTEGAMLLEVTEETIESGFSMVKPRYTNDKARQRAVEQRLLENTEYGEQRERLRQLQRQALELRVLIRFLERRNVYAQVDYEHEKTLDVLRQETEKTHGSTFRR